MNAPSTSPVLDVLTTDERDLVLGRTSRRVYHPGDLLVVDGAGTDRMFFVESGCVAVRTTTRAGDQVTLAVLGPGSSFGEETFVEERRHSPDVRRPSHVVALDRVEARVLRRDDFLDLCRRARRPSSGSWCTCSRHGCAGCPTRSSTRST